MRHALILAAIPFLIAGTAQSAETWSMRVNNVSRNLLVHAPSGVAGRPLLLSLHGLNQDAAYQRSTTAWEAVADTAKFVVVFPNAVNKSWDISGTNDINFLTAIMDSVAKRYNTDKNRVYVSGFSMGGMMSYHVANRIADRVAAIAPVSGYLFANPVASSRPMPIIHIHGTTDDVVRYNGLAAILTKWRSWNACPTNAQVTDPYPANKPASAAARQYWGPCRNNSAISHISIENKGHWHSNDLASVHSSIEIWNFVKQYSLSSSTSANRPASPASIRTIWSKDGLNVVGGEGVRSLRLVDLQGRMVASFTPRETWSGQALLSVSSLPRGMYHLRVEEAKGTTTIAVGAP